MEHLLEGEGWDSKESRIGLTSHFGQLCNVRLLSKHNVGRPWVVEFGEGHNFSAGHEMCQVSVGTASIVPIEREDWDGDEGSWYIIKERVTSRRGEQGHSETVSEQEIEVTRGSAWGTQTFTGWQKSELQAPWGVAGHFGLNYGTGRTTETKGSGMTEKGLAEKLNELNSETWSMDYFKSHDRIPQTDRGMWNCSCQYLTRYLYRKQSKGE